MANPRILDRPQRQRLDGRYFVTVYTADGGPGKRVYLGGKDGERAMNLFAAIKKPLGDGDVQQVQHRLKRLGRVKTWGILTAAQPWLDQDNPEQAEQVQKTGLSQDENGNLILQTTEPYSDDEPLVDNVMDIFAAMIRNGQFELIGQKLAWGIDALHAHDQTEVLTGLHSAFTETIFPLKRKRYSHKKLSDALAYWLALPMAKRTKQQTRRWNQMRFEDFIQFAGDIPVDALRKRHITDYEAHVDDQSAKKSAQIRNKYVSPVKYILSTVFDKAGGDGENEFPFDERLPVWLRAIDTLPYRAKEENKTAIRPEDFRKLLAVADAWASIDVATYAAKLPLNGSVKRLAKTNNIRKAQRRKAWGLRWSLMLRLACQTGYGPTDLSELCFDHFRLEGGKVPFVDLARGKPAHRIGAPIEAMIPLLPATIKAYERLCEYDRREREHVFYSDKNRPFRPDSITTGWEELCKEAKVETFQANGKGVPAHFRFCRNVGSSIGLKHSKEISVDQREYFLRHSNNQSMHKRYEDQGMVIDETFVLDLVNRIGIEYFREQVGE